MIKVYHYHLVKEKDMQGPENKAVPEHATPSCLRCGRTDGSHREGCLNAKYTFDSKVRPCPNVGCEDGYYTRTIYISDGGEVAVAIREKCSTCSGSGKVITEACPKLRPWAAASEGRSFVTINTQSDKPENQAATLPKEDWLPSTLTCEGGFTLGVTNYPKVGHKYLRTINPREPRTGQQPIQVDVYCVLEAFKPVNDAVAHALKKLLCAGQRDKGSCIQDLKEAIEAIERAITIEEQKNNPDKGVNYP